MTTVYLDHNIVSRIAGIPTTDSAQALYVPALDLKQSRSELTPSQLKKMKGDAELRKARRNLCAMLGFWRALLISQ